MPVRSLIADFSWLTQSTVVATASATGSTITGFEPVNALSPLLPSAWQSPASGPHTITLTDSEMTGGVDMVCVCAHPEFPFTGTVTVALYNATPSLLWQSSTSYRPPVGMLDRRIFVLPARQTGATNVRVTLATGNRLAYVLVFRAIDITGFAASTADLPVVDQVGGTQVGFGAYAWDVAKRSAPGRTLRGDVVMSGLPYTTMRALFRLVDTFGKSEPVLWVPNAESDTADVANIEYMQATSVLGLIKNNPAFAFTGTGTCVDDSGATITGPLRSATIQLDGWA